MMYDVFGVNCILLISAGCVICEASVVDENYFNMAVCIIESESFLVSVIDVVLDDCDFVHVSVEH